jgi:hypothetical protein
MSLYAGLRQSMRMQDVPCVACCREKEVSRALEMRFHFIGEQELEVLYAVRPDHAVDSDQAPRCKPFTCSKACATLLIDSATIFTAVTSIVAGELVINVIRWARACSAVSSVVIECGTIEGDEDKLASCNL